MKLLLNTIREIKYDQKLLINELSENELKDNVAVCLIHPNTYNNIVSKSGVNLKLTTNYGSIILKPVWDESIPLETIYVNKSIWANQIIGDSNNKIQYKNIDVEVEPTEEPVPEVSDILKKLINI
jgi:formylmethanofuran dehydrogenase subunit D